MTAQDPVTIRTPRRDHRLDVRPSVLIECDGGRVPDLHRSACPARLDVTTDTKLDARRKMLRAGWRRVSLDGADPVDLCPACTRSLTVPD